MTTAKAYKGFGMEGAIARWYTKNTGQNLSRFPETARLVAERARPGSQVLKAVHLYYLLVRNELNELAVVRVRVRFTFAGSGFGIVREGDSERAVFSRIECMHPGSSCHAVLSTSQPWMDREAPDKPMRVVHSNGN